MTAGNGGAWLLKCNPKRWDLRGFLDAGRRTISSWTINTSKPGIAVGQPVLLWVTGDTGVNPVPGVWGAGVITGQPSKHHGKEEGQHWLTSSRSALWLPVDISLFDTPVARYVFENDPRLADLQILRQPYLGNPQPVTAQQFATIERYLARENTDAYGPLARARAVVIDEYRRNGWTVNHTAEPGWDLTCRHGKNELRVVARPADQATLGRAEITAASHPDWRLVVVDGTSKLTEYDGIHVLDYAEPVTYVLPQRRPRQG